MKWMLFPFLILSVCVFTAFPQLNTSAIVTETELLNIGISGVHVVSGTYSLSQNLRILDAIKRANHDSLPDLSKINCRSVSVRIKVDETYKEEKYDLLKFISTGDLKENPYLQAGIQIHLDHATQWINITGDILGPLTGKVPIRKNENAWEFLKLFTFNATADTAKIHLKRVGYKLIVAGLSELKRIDLHHNDCITVFPRQNKREIFRVSINGEILRPGLYPIHENQTKAYDIIKMAGGPNPSGEIRKAYIIRRRKIDSLPKEGIFRENSATQVDDFRNNIISKDYAIIPLGTRDEILENEDEIVIPKKEKKVYISGNVELPGAYDFKPGENIKYYVKKAGGFSKRADRKKIKHVVPYGEAYKIIENKNVYAGDIIVVPEKQPGQRIVMDIIRTMISTASVVVAAVAVYRD